MMMQILKGIIGIVLFCTLKIYGQTPQLDSATLYNGLKICLLPCGEDSVLNIRLVINGGKKNENECQVGYSEIIAKLLESELNEKQKVVLKKEHAFKCVIKDGQTTLSSNCSRRSLNKKIELLSSTLSRLFFTKQKIDPIVSAISEGYLPEKISANNLAHIYKDLLLYGKENPLGRSYCQYQIQKVTVEQLREFFVTNYTPKRASLLVCGNFNVTKVKKIISKNFVTWKTLRKLEVEAEHYDVENPKIKSKEIAIINKSDAKDHQLTWLRPAPSFTSSEHIPFLVACDLFDSFLKEKDSLEFKPSVFSSGLIETTCVTNATKAGHAIKLFDSTLQTFQKLEVTKVDLENSVKRLTDNYTQVNTSEMISSFFDPLVFNFDYQKDHLANLSAITSESTRQILKKYFVPDAYKLLVVGKAHLVLAQLSSLGKVVQYETCDFETCDESCKEIVIVKCHCESCYRRGYCNVWRFDPSEKTAIKNAKSRAKYTVK